MKKYFQLNRKDNGCYYRNYIETAPTGSGKTHYIINNLIPDALRQRKKVLYVSNRKIILFQVRKKLRKLAQKCPKLAPLISNLVATMSYQEIETCLEHQRKIADINCYDFIILDEAHYFWADANFNPKTLLSYQYLMGIYRGTRIIMSASLTADMIMYFKTTIEQNHANPNVTGRYSLISTFSSLKIAPTKPIEKDFSYLDIRAIGSREDIVKLVQTSGKAVIFVHSIAEGEMIQKYLKENEIDCSLLTSSYRREEEMSDTMYDIVNHESYDTKVLIATAVIDNGVNIVDQEVNKIIVLTNTKISLEQMLSRRRVHDGERIILGLHKRDKKHFTELRRSLERTWSVYEQFKYTDMYGECIPPQVYFNASRDVQDEMKKFCFFYNNYTGYQVLRINLFSIGNLSSQINNCEEIAERFDKDGKDAFLLQQVEWLSPSPESLLPFIDDSRDALIDEFHKLLDYMTGKAYSKHDFSDLLKGKSDDERFKALPDIIRKLSTKKISNSTLVSENHFLDVLSAYAPEYERERTKNPVTITIHKRSE